MRRTKELPQAMCEWWVCDPDTGEIRWKTAPRNIGRYRRPVGSLVAISVHGKEGNQYQYVRFAGSFWAVHRVVWFLCTGEQPATVIDHRNGDAFCNRLSNLRPATNSQNQANSRARLRSYPKGVTVNRKSGGFNATIMVNRKGIKLGRFETVEAAHEAYLAAAKQHFGEFARAA